MGALPCLSPSDTLSLPLQLFPGVSHERGFEDEKSTNIVLHTLRVC